MSFYLFFYIFILWLIFTKRSLILILFQIIIANFQEFYIKNHLIYSLNGCIIHILNKHINWCSNAKGVDSLFMRFLVKMAIVLKCFWHIFVWYNNYNIFINWLRKNIKNESNSQKKCLFLLYTRKSNQVNTHFFIYSLIMINVNLFISN